MNATVAPTPEQIVRHLVSRPVTKRLADWEQAAAQTARRVSFRFGLSGLRWGQDGPVSLMLHGWAGRPTQFAALIEPLVSAGRQVIALDAPGHGSSAGDRGTLMEFVMALHEVAIEIQQLESVVGHSMGGAAVALALADGLPADRAVLFAPPSSFERQMRNQAARLGLDADATNSLIRAMENANGAPVSRFEIQGKIDSIQIPGLVVHDRSDREVPFVEGQRIASAWSTAELIATEGLGHNRLLSDPEVVGKVGGFLAGRLPVVQ